MTLHIKTMGSGTFCGDLVSRPISLSVLVRFYPLSHWVMSLVGCRKCGVELLDALATARPIR